jgi:hypothetical protein
MSAESAHLSAERLQTTGVPSPPRSSLPLGGVGLGHVIAQPPYAQSSETRWLNAISRTYADFDVGGPHTATTCSATRACGHHPIRAMSGSPNSITHPPHFAVESDERLSGSGSSSIESSRNAHERAVVQLPEVMTPLIAEHLDRVM